MSGNLSSVGSDTMNNLMQFWAEGFNGLYPNTNLQIEGKGSSTAPPALIEGTSHDRRSRLRDAIALPPAKTGSRKWPQSINRSAMHFAFTRQSN